MIKPEPISRKTSKKISQIFKAITNPETKEEFEIYRDFKERVEIAERNLNEGMGIQVK